VVFVFTPWVALNRFVALEDSLIAQSRANGLSEGRPANGTSAYRNHWSPVRMTFKRGRDDFCRRFGLMIVHRPEGFSPWIAHSIGIAGITCRNGSRSKSYWTKARQGIKLVNALSEESVGHTNHGLGGQPNDRFIPEAVARRMFASLTLSSCRLS
jgi:hypothetical protein